MFIISVNYGAKWLVFFTRESNNHEWQEKMCSHVKITWKENFFYSYWSYGGCSINSGEALFSIPVKKATKKWKYLESEVILKEALVFLPGVK